MRLHAERGDRPAALRQFERCAELLQRKLELRPSPETEALRREIASATGEPPRNVQGDALRAEHPAAETRTTLVVLPFTASSTDSTAQLLADGLTDDVITELSRFRQIAVLARTSAPPDASTSAHAMHQSAALMLSGSVRVAAGRVRVTASLVDTTTGLQMWGERWQVEHDSLFQVLDRLTQSVVAALALRIDEARLGQARSRSRESLEAYECWLRGLECLRRGTPASDDEARTFFEQALKLAPQFARAYSGISLSHFNDWSCQAWDRWNEREKLAFENASRAVALDDGDHVTHCILGRIYIYRREFALGERHLEQAIALNANDADILMHCAIGFSQLAHPERGQELSEAALRLNPKPPDWYYACAAFPHFVARNLEASVRLALRAPDCLVDTRATLAAACAHRGDIEQARQHLGKFLEHFRTKITFGRDPEPGEPARWLLHVNPFARESDAKFLSGGLERAACR